MKILTKKSMTYLIVLAAIGISNDSFGGGDFDEQEKKTENHISKNTDLNSENQTDPVVSSLLAIEKELCDMIHEQSSLSLTQKTGIPIVYDDKGLQFTRTVVPFKMDPKAAKELFKLVR